LRRINNIYNKNMGNRIIIGRVLIVACVLVITVGLYICDSKSGSMVLTAGAGVVGGFIGMFMKKDDDKRKQKEKDSAINELD